MFSGSFFLNFLVLSLPRKRMRAVRRWAAVAAVERMAEAAGAVSCGLLLRSDFFYHCTCIIAFSWVACLCVGGFCLLQMGLKNVSQRHLREGHSVHCGVLEN